MSWAVRHAKKNNSMIDSRQIQDQSDTSALMDGFNQVTKMVLAKDTYVKKIK